MVPRLAALSTGGSTTRRQVRYAHAVIDLAALGTPAEMDGATGETVDTWSPFPPDTTAFASAAASPFRPSVRRATRAGARVFGREVALPLRLPRRSNGALTDRPYSRRRIVRRLRLTKPRCPANVRRGWSNRRHHPARRFTDCNITCWRGQAFGVLMRIAPRQSASIGGIIGIDLAPGASVSFAG